MKKKVNKLIANLMFFFDVVLALLIILWAQILTESSFGNFSMFFGFAMLFITTFLKILRTW
ncbi:hypothetical protein J4402_05310 [Candidatus Pacearchaeota archaeon]|nr:hypothetical protein [Candidatus Pacearchaeota archaeon]